MYPYNINRGARREISAQLNKPKPPSMPSENPPAENIPPENMSDNMNENMNENNSNGTPNDMPDNRPNNNSNCMPKPSQPVANRYILEMLKSALADEATDANYYDRLAKMMTCPEDSELVHRIHHDENKHYNILKNIYYELTGEKINDVEYEEKELSPVLWQNFANSVISELDGAEFYRKLLFSFLNVEIRDWMTEIMTDEQAHAQIMNYLFSKYYRCDK